MAQDENLPGTEYYITNQRCGADGPIVVDLNSSKAQIISYFRDNMTTGLKVRNKSFADQSQIVFGISGETLKEQSQNLKSEFKDSLPKDYQDYFYLLVVEI